MFKQIMPLSLIISMRFFGLFIVLPVISIYAFSFPGATPQIVGLIIGGYALTQMIFQIPFGAMSDILGRKGTIVTGLILIAIGSFLCAIATDLATLLLGRLLQGAGAIGAVVSAMIGDLVKEEQRPKALAMMGGTIAMSFALAMIVGPIIGGNYGIDTLFFIASFIALASIFVILKMVPDAPKVTHTYHNMGKLEFLKNKNIHIMNITNFLQKGLMTFAFMIIPIILTKSFAWELSELWKIYIPAMIAGIFAMGPAAVLAEKKGKFKEVLMVGIVFFAIAYYIMGDASNETLFLTGVVVFFIGFNMHEPIMQSLIIKYARVHEKGKVLGVSNTFGYAGTFLGGLIGGLYFQEIDGSFNSSLETITTFIIVISLVWIVLIAALPNPLKTKNIYHTLEELDEEKFNTLDTIDGINEWYINNTENIIIVKYNSDLVNEEDILTKIKK
ncbi:MAG TPA: MFS transporter [Arcobacter sp.]|jgi:MFS family permease|nr:MFS transporter [Arcobacter sp.]